MSKQIFIRDSVHETGNPNGKRGIVVGQVTEKFGVRLYEVRWENGITTHHKFGEIESVGSLLPGIDKRFG